MVMEATKRTKGRNSMKKAHVIWRDRRTTILGAAIAVQLFVLASPAGAAVGPSGRIYFSTWRDAGYNLNIYSVNPATVTPLAPNGDVASEPAVNTPKADYSPVWSVDNSTLAFSSTRDGDYEIFTYTPTTGQLRQLTKNRIDDIIPSWSPPLADGQARIAWMQQGKGNQYDLMVMKSDGSGQTPLVALRKSDEQMGSWSPDGSKIVYTSDASDNHEIYAANVTVSSGAVSVSGTTRLTDSPNEAEISADWSPDGSTIVYVKDPTMPRYTGYGRTDIWTMAPDGSNEQPLADVGVLDLQPDWSPDGTRIALVSTPLSLSDDYQASHDQAEVYTIDATGGSLSRITQNSVGDFQPDWR